MQADFNGRVFWMRGRDADWSGERQEMVVGMCSNPEPPPEIKDRPLPQPLLVWYELAELEAETVESQLALTALRQRTVKSGLLPMERMLASRLLQAATRALDVNRFVEALNNYPHAVLTAVTGSETFNVFDMSPGLLKPVGKAEWSEKAIHEVTLKGRSRVCSVSNLLQSM